LFNLFRLTKGDWIEIQNFTIFAMNSYKQKINTDEHSRQSMWHYVAGISRLLLATFAVVLLTSCSLSRPLSPQQSDRILGSFPYGLVLRITGGVEADVAKSDVCLKRDALCMMALAEASRARYATVQLYGSVVFLKTIVPPNYYVDAGDIVKLNVPTRQNEIPTIASVGAKRWERSAACDWVDGTPNSLKGGVVCKGWSYKTISEGN